jgi:flagellar hook-associated protein 2
MAQITSTIGLISGIDTGTLINELIAIDSAPVTLLQTHIASAQAQQQAYATIETQINNIQTIGNTLALPQSFKNSLANSSNQNVLTATTGTAAALGTYQFQISRLVSTQQTISTGFADPTSTPVGAGTLTLEEGGGEAFSQSTLASLNGGAGVQRGQFRVTDGTGNSSVIDTSNDVTLDDVVKQINTAVGIDVHAAVTNQGIVLTDESGGAGRLTVADLNGGASAKSLGIAGSGAGAITGTTINFINANTPLTQLNDGNGVTMTTPGQADLLVTVGDGTVISVNLNAATTVGGVINAINAAGGAKLSAAVNPSGNGIQLTDNSGGGGAFTVANAVGSQAATGLGLTGAAAGNAIVGAPLISGLDSVLVRTLNGGAGIALGTISINDGVNPAATIDLSGANSVNDIINLINNNGSANVTASLNAAGTGIQIVNNTGAGNMVVADVVGTSAAALGLAGTFNAGATDAGANLQRQFVSANTLLSTYNGGRGVTPGQFQITNSNGISASVDLSQGTFTTIGDVMRAINAKNIGVTASINSQGNGILLTDTAGGAQKLTVQEQGSTTAANLNILGAATATTIDGAMQKTITVTNTDTLTTLQNKINQLGFGVTATIINDGSPSAPYRLSLTSVNSGAAGRVVIDGGTTSLGLTNLVSGQDAAVFYGGDGSSQPLLVTSNTNQLTNLIKGVTVNLVGASGSPVTLSVTADPSNVITQLQNFVTAFNAAVSAIDTDSQFNTTTNQGGILLGDGTTQSAEQALYNMFNSVVNGTGAYHNLSDMGITINTTAGIGSATLNFNQSAFQTAFANNPTSVQNLFSQATTGLGTVISNAMQALDDPVDGRITLENNTLTTQIQQYQDQITTLNQLQSQGAIISALGTIKSAAASGSSSSSGASASASSGTSTG